MHVILMAWKRLKSESAKCTFHSTLIWIERRGVFNAVPCLAELYQPNFRFAVCYRGGDIEQFSDPSHQNFMMMYYRHLRNWIIKNASYRIRYGNLDYQSVPFQPARPQGVLVNMVRRHSSLRWLRSDLSAENIYMLRQERPEITFVRVRHSVSD